MFYYCKACKRQILSLEDDINLIVCPTCKSKNISIGGHIPSEMSKQLLVNNRSKIMNQTGNASGLPIIDKGKFGYLDYNAYGNIWNSIEKYRDASKFRMFKSIQKIKIINSKTNFVDVAHDNSFYLSIGTSSFTSTREILRLIPNSPKLTKCYSEFINFLIEKIKFNFNQNNFIKLFLEKVNEYVISVLPNNNTKAVDNFILDKYHKRRDPNVERLITPNSQPLGFILDIDELINNGLGVCRHRNLLNAYLLGKLIFELFSTPSQNLQLRYNLPISSISRLKSIFNIRSKVYQPRGDIIKRNNAKVDIVGAHTWCSIILNNTNKEYSGIYIVDGMWRKVYDLQNPKDYQKAIEPSLGGYTYDTHNIKRLINMFEEQNFKYGRNNKPDDQMSLIKEDVVKEDYDLHEKPVNWKNESCEKEIKHILKPFLTMPILERNEFNVFNQLCTLINYNDFLNTYINLKNFNAYVEAYQGEETSYRNILEISQICTEIIEKYIK